jgi:Coenzyme PQQ synthesis protein D (PqqD)
MDLLMDHPRRHPDAAFRRIGDEGGLVVLPGRSEVKVLNPVGIAVFSLLDGSRDVNDLAEAVAAEFDIDLNRAREDVMAFLTELQHEGMLGDGAAPPDGKAS